MWNIFGIPEIYWVIGCVAVGILGMTLFATINYLILLLKIGWSKLWKKKS